MANLQETPEWEDGIYQFEETDVVQGGPQGIDNVPTGQLANRTAYLKQEQDALKKQFDNEETPDPLPQYIQWDHLVGFKLTDSFAGIDRTAIALKGDGTEINRADFPKLLQFAVDNDLLEDQAAIDANPTQYAANYGTGDGSTTFTLPNYGLMPWEAAAGMYGAAGTTVEDAIRNIKGAVWDIAGGDVNNYFGANGAFKKQDSSFVNAVRVPEASVTATSFGDGFEFNASLAVPTSDVNRPKTHFLDVWIIHGEVA